MKTRYKPSFLKDLKRLRGSAEYDRIYQIVFDDVLRWETLAVQTQIKRLSAKEQAYRLRVGDYRIGFFYTRGTITFARVLHRREIYRYFP